MTVLRPTNRMAVGREGGSILIETVLGVVILALAAWLSVDLLTRLAHRQRGTAFVADLRAIAATFRSYAAESKGTFPAATSSDQLPDALLARLKETNWPRGSPFGGQYEWIPGPALLVPLKPGARPPPPRPGRIAVTAFGPSFPLTASRGDLLRVDAALDDGNLATGRFRTGFNGWPVYDLGDK